MWTRAPHRVIARGLAAPRARSAPDPEGRLLGVEIEVEGVQLFSVYLPSGSSSPERQVAKDAWMAEFLPWARRLHGRRKPVVIAGDLNIAHTERDIFYAKANAKQSGFLPHEREWFGELVGRPDGSGGSARWVDLVRRDAGDTDGPYSWWSNRGRARAEDRGWRIDYLLANTPAARRVGALGTDRAASVDGVSDHAPVWCDLDLP